MYLLKSKYIKKYCTSPKAILKQSTDNNFSNASVCQLYIKRQIKKARARSIQDIFYKLEDFFTDL